MSDMIRYRVDFHDRLAMIALPHWLGIVGELLNLIGGVILAYDLLSKKKQRRKQERNQEVSEMAIQYGLKSTTTYQGHPIAS